MVGLWFGLQNFYVDLCSARNMNQREQTLGEEVQSQIPTIQRVQVIVRGPRVKIIHRVVDALEVAQRQAPGVKKVQITEEAQLDQCIDRTVVMQRRRQVMNILTIRKTAEVPKEQFVDKGSVVRKRHEQTVTCEVYRHDVGRTDCYSKAGP